MRGDDCPTASGVVGESAADRGVFFWWAASVLVGERGDRIVFWPSARLPACEFALLVCQPAPKFLKPAAPVSEPDFFFDF